MCVYVVCTSKLGAWYSKAKQRSWCWGYAPIREIKTNHVLLKCSKNQEHHAIFFTQNVLRCCAFNKVFLVNHWRDILNNNGYVLVTLKST